MKVSLIVPAYNEEQVIERTVCRALSFLAQTFSDYELVVINDGSTDQTAEILSRYQHAIKLVNILKNCGKGNAVRQGILASDGDVLFFTDADLSYDLEYIKKALPLLSKYDIVAGCRTNQREGYSFFRRLLSKTFAKLAKSVLKCSLTDTQCGFKGFRAHAAKSVCALCSLNGFAFDVEMLYVAEKYGFSMHAMDVCANRQTTKSKVNFIKDPLLMAADILRVKLNDFGGKYEPVATKTEHF